VSFVPVHDCSKQEMLRVFVLFMFLLLCSMTQAINHIVILFFFVFDTL